MGDDLREGKPTLPLIRVMFMAQVVNGLMLPVILVFVMLLSHRRSLLGDLASGRASLALALLVAAVAGAAMAAIHAFLVITLRASQIVSGLALTIFAGAAGLSSYLGNDLDLAANPARHQFTPVFPESMQQWPLVGPLLFGQTVLAYASWLCVIAVWLYLSRTRPGLNVRAVGESPASADAMGINVTVYRYAHVLVGGALAREHRRQHDPVVVDVRLVAEHRLEVDDLVAYLASLGGAR